MTRKEALDRFKADKYAYYHAKCDICDNIVGAWSPGEALKLYYHRGAGMIICRDIDCHRAAEKKASEKV